MRAVAAHPGLASTNLSRDLGGVRRVIAWLGVTVIAQDPAHGALPTLYAATQDISGNSYVGPNGLGHMRGYPALLKPAKNSQDPELAARLWARSAKLTGVDSPVPSAV